MVGYSSDLLAAGTQVGQNGIDALLVDGAQGSGGNTQLHPTVLRSHPEAALVQVGEETAAGLVVGVRDVVAGLHALAGNLANAGHTHLERSGVAHSPGDGGPAAGSSWTGRTRCGKGFDCTGGAGSRSGPDPATAGRSEPPIMRGQVVDCNRKGKGVRGKVEGGQSHFSCPPRTCARLRPGKSDSDPLPPPPPPAPYPPAPPPPQPRGRSARSRLNTPGQDRNTSREGER